MSAPILSDINQFSKEGLKKTEMQEKNVLPTAEGN